MSEPSRTQIENELKSSLRQRQLLAWSEEYKELSELWRHLDNKAQSMVPLVGILMAAFVGFVTKGSSTHCVADKVLSILVIISLAVSAGLFVLALNVRESSAPPHYGGTIQSMIDELLNAPDWEVRLDVFYKDETSVWTESNDSVRAVTARKAILLAWAQRAVFVSILLLALFALIQILEQ